MLDIIQMDDGTGLPGERGCGEDRACRDVAAASNLSGKAKGRPVVTALLQIRQKLR